MTARFGLSPDGSTEEAIARKVRDTRRVQGFTAQADMTGTMRILRRGPSVEGELSTLDTSNDDTSAARQVRAS